MIEVEKKFKVQPGDLGRLLRGATKMDEIEFTDVYYDTRAHDLTLKSIWLRSRENRFELKFPMGVMADKARFTQYDEIEDDGLIAARLGITPGEKPLVEALASRGYLPFATIRTKRQKYKKEGLNIDVDEADYGWSVVEIEAMVGDTKEVEEAYGRIIGLAVAAGIAVGKEPVRGKVIEYIRRNDPAHFAALEKAWGIPL